MNLSGTVIILPTPNLPQTHPQQHTAGIITDREHKADSRVVKKTSFRGKPANTIVKVDNTFV